ncbi:MAG: cbb3-type cytochrome oxidase assembly protein CcoS [Azonexus sp.]
MDSLYLLIPLSVLLVFVIAIVFWWSVKSGQFDDLEGPGFKILMDDDGPDIPTSGVAKRDDSGKV